MSERNLHRLLAYIAFALTFIYFTRVMIMKERVLKRAELSIDASNLAESESTDVEKKVSPNLVENHKDASDRPVKITPDTKVSEIRVRSGNLVDAVQFIMADGKVKNGGYNPSGGDAAPAFGLDPIFTLDGDEHIKKIEVAQQDRLAGLRFVSTKGRVSQWYGTKRGQRMTFLASTSNPIIAIEREAGGICPPILRAMRLDGSMLEPSSPQRSAAARGGPAPPHLRVAQVRVRAGDLIDMVEFVMADGSVVNGGFSSLGGKAQPPFELGPDEAVVRIEARQGAALEAVRLRTSAGRESPWYGKQDGGEVKAFAGEASNPIVGFDRGLAAACPPIVGVRLLDEAE